MNQGSEELFQLMLENNWTEEDVLQRLKIIQDEVGDEPVVNTNNNNESVVNNSTKNLSTETEETHELERIIDLNISINGSDKIKTDKNVNHNVYECKVSGTKLGESCDIDTTLCINSTNLSYEGDDESKADGNLGKDGEEIASINETNKTITSFKTPLTLASPTFIEIESIQTVSNNDRAPEDISDNRTELPQNGNPPSAADNISTVEEYKCSCNRKHKSVKECMPSEIANTKSRKIYQQCKKYKQVDKSIRQKYINKNRRNQFKLFKNSLQRRLNPLQLRHPQRKENKNNDLQAIDYEEMIDETNKLASNKQKSNSEDLRLRAKDKNVTKHQKNINVLKGQDNFTKSKRKGCDKSLVLKRNKFTFVSHSKLMSPRFPFTRKHYRAAISRYKSKGCILYNNKKLRVVIYGKPRIVARINDLNKCIPEIVNCDTAIKRITLLNALKDIPKTTEKVYNYITKSLPKVSLNVVPEIGKPLHPRFQNLINLNYQLLNEEEVRFALTAVKDNTPFKPQLYTFPLCFKNDQKTVSVQVSNERNLLAQKEYSTVSDTENNEAAKSVLEDMMNYIDRSIEISNAVIEDDYELDVGNEVDASKVVSNSKMYKVDKSMRRVNLELKRLNCPPISIICNKDSAMDGSKCKNKFCELGCVCNSIACYSSNLLATHCGNKDCMFKCTCGNKKNGERRSIIPQGSNQYSEFLLKRIDDHAKKDLAKFQKEFAQTFIKADDRLIMMGKSNTGRRETRFPKRYKDYNIDEAHKIAEVYSDNGKTESLNEPSCEVTIKQCYITLEKIDLSSIIPFCMIHKVYQCVCIYNSGNIKQDRSIVSYTAFSPLKQHYTNSTNIPGENRILSSARIAAPYATHYIQRNKTFLYQKELNQKVHAYEEASNRYLTENRSAIISEAFVEESHAVKCKQLQHLQMFLKETLEIKPSILNYLIKNCGRRPYRHIRWDTLLQFFKKEVIKIWYGESENVPRLIISDGRIPVGPYCDINDLHYTTTTTTEIPNVIARALINGTSPSDKSVDKFIVVLTPLHNFYQIFGVCEEKDPIAQNTQDLINKGINRNSLRQEETECSMEKKLNVVKILKNIKKYKLNIKLKRYKFLEKKFIDIYESRQVLCASLPNLGRNFKWRVVYITNEYQYLYFHKSHFPIKFVKIMEVIEMAIAKRTTYFLKSTDILPSRNKFGIYCVPHYSDRIFIGPYHTREETDLAEINVNDNRVQLRLLWKQKQNDGSTWLKQLHAKARNPSILIPPPPTIIDLTNSDEVIEKVKLPEKRILTEQFQKPVSKKLKLNKIVKGITKHDNELVQTDQTASTDLTSNISTEYFIVAECPDIGYITAFQHHNSDYIDVICPITQLVKTFPDSTTALNSIKSLLENRLIIVSPLEGLKLRMISQTENFGNSPLNKKILDGHHVVGIFGVRNLKAISNEELKKLKASNAEISRVLIKREEVLLHTGIFKMAKILNISLINPNASIENILFTATQEIKNLTETESQLNTKYQQLQEKNHQQMLKCRTLLCELPEPDQRAFREIFKINFIPPQSFVTPTSRKNTSILKKSNNVRPSLPYKLSKLNKKKQEAITHQLLALDNTFPVNALPTKSKASLAIPNSIMFNKDFLPIPDIRLKKIVPSQKEPTSPASKLIVQNCYLQASSVPSTNKNPTTFSNSVVKIPPSAIVKGDCNKSFIIAGTPTTNVPTIVVSAKNIPIGTLRASVLHAVPVRRHLQPNNNATPISSNLQQSPNANPIMFQVVAKNNVYDSDKKLPVSSSSSLEPSRNQTPTKCQIVDMTDVQVLEKQLSSVNPKTP